MSRSPSRWAFWRSVLAAAAGLAILLAGRAACLRFWPLALPSASGRALPGIRVGGVPLEAGRPAEAQVEDRVRALGDRPVRLAVREAPDDVRVVAETTLGALGVSADATALGALVLSLGRAGDVVSRARLAVRARRGDLDVPIQPSIDPAVAAAGLVTVKEGVDVPPVPARLNIEQNTIVPEREGRALDVDAAIAVIARAARGPLVDPVLLPLVAVMPHATRASLAGIDVSHVLSSFATYFSRRGEQAPRAQNIEVAASHVDGLILEPGELVSFNDLVGARSGDNGFQKAFEIFKGEMVEGTGGGTCQVASTLHAAAFFGGLDIVQRLPHSRPSAYIPVGLDATVAYPVVDLKIRNPYAFAVVAHAVVDGNRVSVQLLGAEKPVRVALVRSVIATTPFDRKVVEDPAADKPKRKQRGLDGMKILRKRLIAYPSGQSRVEISRDTYPPTTEIWKVPPGYDESELPPLGQDFPNADGEPPVSPPAPPDPEQTIWGG